MADRPHLHIGLHTFIQSSQLFVAGRVRHAARGYAYRAFGVFWTSLPQKDRHFPLKLTKRGPETHFKDSRLGAIAALRLIQPFQRQSRRQVSIAVLAGLGCIYKTTCWCSIAVASSVAIYRFVFVDVLQFGRFFRRARSFNLLTDGVRGVLADPAARQTSAGLPAAIAVAAKEEE
jgi:hypothetical protein